MNDQPRGNSDLSELIVAVMLDVATEAQLQELDERLLVSAEARAEYRRHINLQVSLRVRDHASHFTIGRMETLGITDGHDEQALGSESIVPLKDARKKPTRRRLLAASILTGAIAATVLIAVGQFAGNWVNRRQFTWRSIDSVKTAVAASVTQCIDARWSDRTSPVAVGEPLGAGILELPQGLVEITFASGAVTLLQAPARMKVVSANRAILLSGRVVVHVPIQAIGFSIDTGNAHIVDLGTEFGVEASLGGNTEVQVFEGTVLTRDPDKASGNDSGETRRLVKGEAVDYGTNGLARMVEYTPDRFIRTFPKAPICPLGGPLYSTSRLDALEVPWAMHPPKIDGRLADWPKADFFHSACVEPYAQTYYLDGAMRYDADCLYLAAHVGDPFPMQNSDDEGLFSGGSVVVRLSTSRQFGWPLDSISPVLTRYSGVAAGNRLQDTTDRIVHLIIWYHRPTSTPRLNLSFGMDFHDDHVAPTDWKGIFRKDADGQGYSFEYAIPWKTLRAGEDPPRAGDQLGLVWTAHWSDAAGKFCRGHLVEITNPACQPYNFLNARTWGKAVYQSPKAATDANLKTELLRLGSIFE